MLLLGSHLICTLIFNFVLLCVFYFFFFSLSLSLLFDKIFYSCTRTHTCICAHKCARARSLPAADALRSLTHTGPAESRVARARYDVSLAHTHAFVHTHIQRQSSSFCCHIFCTFLFRFSTLPFYHFFSNVHSFFFVCFALLNRCHLVVQQHLHLASPLLLLLSLSTNQRIKTKSASVLQNADSRLSIADDSSAINCVDYEYCEREMQNIN